jgi:prephenate dehydrogenase
MINSPMWTEIFLENRELLTGHIDKFAKSLADIRSLIAGGKAAELEAWLDVVRERRRAMQ